MPQIFDNIETEFLPALQEAMAVSERADFCVGYFNLRGWRYIDGYVEQWAGGDGKCCRLLVGMNPPTEDRLLQLQASAAVTDEMDNATALRLKTKLAGQFRNQLTFGRPTDADEAGLRRLAGQIRSGKLQVKLFLRHPLHAKLYLLRRPDKISPKIGYLGSSNLTMAGLSKQGELNIDITDQDAWDKLARWFEDRWNDKFCLDISEQLIAVIEESWARKDAPPPYYIYLKMAWHLGADVRLGDEEYLIPKEFGNKLLAFQEAAVKLALRKLERHGGVIIGDVVGLGKTLVASAIAKTLQERDSHETLIICPPNLAEMWESYRLEYGINAQVHALSMVHKELPDLRRFRTVLVDESHNLRNRETTAYKAIRNYIEKNESKVILLTATPYNKTLLDLSSQLRLFIAPDKQLPVRPEHYIRQHGLPALTSQTQADPHTIVAFEKSDLAEDWRILMDQFLIRRTRHWIKKHYAKTDPENQRPYLLFANGQRSYFPQRVPKNARFTVDSADSNDQYARMFSDRTLDAINQLHLPRYGLGNYVKAPLHRPDTSRAHEEIISDLSRAGRYLVGFCRTNLFKRLESSGAAFGLTLHRHLLRDQLVLHALRNNLDVPIGTADSALFETAASDADAEDKTSRLEIPGGVTALDEVAAAYEACRGDSRIRWLPAAFFEPALAEHLAEDIAAVEGVSSFIGEWNPQHDHKLSELLRLLQREHGGDKVLVFTQFADTAKYLYRQLRQAGLQQLEVVTGDTDDPTAVARRFSPHSATVAGQRPVTAADELRVLISTDVLSEGQNLQDCHIVVNYDLPWALIRIIQRIGRVDRIGQTSQSITCYSFIPADGVESIIRLHQRIVARQKQEAQVLGSDEVFMEGESFGDLELFQNLYNERPGVYDDDADEEVDLASYAWQIWQSAVDGNASLREAVEALPNVVYSTKSLAADVEKRPGVITFVQSQQDNNSLLWVDGAGRTVSESPLEILKAAKCEPDEPAGQRLGNHHDLVGKALEIASADAQRSGGQLGGPRSIRRRLYDRLKDLQSRTAGSLFGVPDLDKVIEEIYHYPLKQAAADALGNRLREGADAEALARLAVDLRSDNALCSVTENPVSLEPRIICSLGLRANGVA